MKVSADFIWDGQRFVDNAVLEIKDGCVERIQVANGHQEDKKADKNYSGCAIIPGFANAHSHAFQRAFRGQTEWSTTNIKDDFWSWRNIMYRYANQLSPDDLYTVTAWTFLEMVKAGITAVGEFHYVHHQKDGAAYTPTSLMSLKIMSAARDVGLKLTLLPVAYHRGGFNRSINTDQRRFSHQTPRTTWHWCKAFANQPGTYQPSRWDWRHIASGHAIKHGSEPAVHSPRRISWSHTFMFASSLERSTNVKRSTAWRQSNS